MNFNWMWGVLSCWLMLLLSALPIFHMWKNHHRPSKQPHCMCDILTNSLQTSSATIRSTVNMSKRLWPTKTKTWNCMDLSCSWICSLFKHCYNCHICDRPHESDMVLAPPLQCAALCPSPHSMSPRIIQSILHISIHLEHSLCILNAPPFGICVCKAIAHKDIRLCSLLEGNVHEYALVKCL
jgi:hypothetical protein